jgi:hypothetical protein
VEFVSISDSKMSLLFGLLFAAHAFASAIPDNASELSKRRDCTKYSYKAETVRLGTYCTSTVDDLVKRQSYPGVGFGCLPMMWLSNSDHRAAGGSDIDNVVDLTGGRQAPIDAWGLSYTYSPPSTNLQAIKLNGGNSDVLNIVYQFNDGTSFPNQCTPIPGNDDGTEAICTSSKIGEVNSGAYWTCPLPNHDIDVYGFENLCGDAISSGCQ